jgi:multidrug efflux system membrane fusion protein
MDDQIEVHRPLSRTDTAVTRARKRNRWVSPLIGLIILGGVGYTGWRLFLAPHEQAARTRGAPPQPVGVATIANGNVSVVLTGLGAVTPLATVTVKTQINGQLQQIAFTEGQMVHKGDFLAQIDPRPYQVALEQAQGTLAKDTALLGQARADLVRYNTLGRQDSIAKQQVEDQAYLVKQDEGTVLNDQAAVDSAKLNLVYCHIVSPVDGKVGIRMVDQGNYVQTSDTNGLVVITQLQPMSVLFTLPEDDVAELQKQFGDHKVAVTAYDRTDTKQIAVGSLATLDNQIDPTTGTVKLRAMFDNTDNALFPQQFVNARLLLNTLENVVVAPQAAIQHGAPGDFVYVVEPGGTVHLQVVKLGVTQGNTVQILEGLKAGDTVVTDGLDRLREGARVTVAAPAGATPAGRPGGGPAGGRRGPRNGTAPANEAEPASPNAAGTSGPNGAGTSGPTGAGAK